MIEDYCLVGLPCVFDREARARQALFELMPGEDPDQRKQARPAADGSQNFFDRAIVRRCGQDSNPIIKERNHARNAPWGHAANRSKKMPL
jgi:hypothetical protein